MKAVVAFFLKINSHNEKVKNMKSWNLLRSRNQNIYYYDRKMKRFHLCHPLLHYILKLSNEMEVEDIRSWLNKLEDNSASNYVNIDEYGHFSKRELEYNFQKFLLLKENGYFTEIDQKERISTRIDAKSIKRNLANCKQVVFEVTDRCNLSCAYCGYGKFYDDYDKRKNKNMDISTAKRLLNYLLTLWNSSFNKSHNKDIHIGFYGGEPLLNFPFIAKIVDYVNQLKVMHNHFSFSITTNGILVQKYMDFLCENNFNLLISLDGNEQSNAYRVFKNGKPAYNTILENINALQRKFPNYFSRRVNFVSVLHNKNSVSDIYHFFKMNFEKVPYIISLNTNGVKESQKKNFWKTYANVEQSLHESEDYSVIERDMFFKLPNIQDTKRFLYNATDFCFENYSHLIYSTDGKKRIPTGTCSPFLLKVFLTVNGKILPCERISHHFYLGKVTPEGVELDYGDIAKKYNNYYDNMRKHCNTCCNSENCDQCIFNIDTIEDEYPLCNGFMIEADYEKYLSSFINYIEDKPEVFSRLLKEENFG